MSTARRSLLLVLAAALGQTRSNELPHHQPAADPDADLIANLDVVERLELLENLGLFDPEEDRREEAPPRDPEAEKGR